MNSVLVGMFDSQADAAEAHGKLLGVGFADSALSMTGGSDALAPSSVDADRSSASSTTAPHHQGAIARFFENLFGSDDDVDDTERAGHQDTYNEAFRRGSYGLTVRTTNEEETDQAERILNESGAIDVDERSQEWRNEGWSGGMNTGNSVESGTGASLETGATQKLQEVQEELKVGKRAVSRGGVRVFTRLTEVPVEESVTLREEHADIRRTAVDRVATAADLNAFNEGSIEIREMGEEAVVSKTARVTGEVEVGKTSTEHAETIRDTVRQTKVDVETLSNDATSDTVR